MKVSVLINNYNYAQYLDYCIQSVLNQTYNDIEIIFYDDGSTDNSLEVIAKYADKVKIISNPNFGKYPSFNQANGIYQAFLISTGDVICLLDSDDAFVSNKIETVVREFKRDSQVVMVQHRMFDINQKNVRTGNIRKKRLIVDENQLNGIYFTGKIDFFFMQTSALSFTREFLNKTLPLDQETFPLIWADVRLTRAAVLENKIITVIEPLGEYRTHPENDSKKLKKKDFFKKFNEQHYQYFNSRAKLANKKALMQSNPVAIKLKVLFYVIFGKLPIKSKLLFLSNIIS